jgi:glycerol-3-phosphate O-acyltransferase
VSTILKCVELGATHGLGSSKFQFGVSHTAIREPFDFYKFGLDFFKPAINLDASLVRGVGNLKLAFDQIKKGENVVFLANHQSEADPQVLSCMLEKVGLGEAAAQVFYVAGHKVTTDTLAIPFSMGRNLICIHSKKYIDVDESTKAAKQKQNMMSMADMGGRMKGGGLALWVAPSGGRDRRNVQDNSIPPAPFDSKTIDMFRLMARKSKVPTHFYPLSMVSYELCPPPDETVDGVGELRNVRYTPVGVHCGAEVVNVGGLEARQDFCARAMKDVETNYAELRRDTIG